MTIDPKAAELARALADAVAAQQTEEYQALAEAAKRKAEIDETAEQAANSLQGHYLNGARVGLSEFNEVWRNSGVSISDAIGHDIFDPPSEPERYDLPEDETATAKPNGGLSE